jgi:hypothetical protein
MSERDPRLSKGITTQAAVETDLSLAHSLWRRGFRRTLHFGVPGHAMVSNYARKTSSLVACSGILLLNLHV